MSSSSSSSPSSPESSAVQLVTLKQWEAFCTSLLRRFLIHQLALQHKDLYKIHQVFHTIKLPVYDPDTIPIWCALKTTTYETFQQWFPSMTPRWKWTLPTSIPSTDSPSLDLSNELWVLFWASVQAWIHETMKWSPPPVNQISVALTSPAFLNACETWMTDFLTDSTFRTCYLESTAHRSGHAGIEGEWVSKLKFQPFKRSRGQQFEYVQSYVSGIHILHKHILQSIRSLVQTKCSPDPKKAADKQFSVVFAEFVSALDSTIHALLTQDQTLYLKQIEKCVPDLHFRHPDHIVSEFLYAYVVDFWKMVVEMCEQSIRTRVTIPQWFDVWFQSLQEYPSLLLSFLIDFKLTSLFLHPIHFPLYQSTHTWAYSKEWTEALQTASTSKSTSLDEAADPTLLKKIKPTPKGD
jgi:hypothetical protein